MASDHLKIGIGRIDKQHQCECQISQCAQFNILDIQIQKTETYGTGGNTSYSRSLGSAITVDASNSELWASYLLDLNETQSG